MHFAAGRQCAARAISHVTGQPTVCALARGPNGEPVWPAGLTGSITHTGNFISAAAARTAAARAIGLDAEQIIAPERAARVASIVMRDDERSVGGETITPAVRLTLLFSIKEAVFKCLYPLVMERFYYSALRVTSLDFGTGQFDARLTVPLPGFPSGHPLTGRFEVDDARVYTGVCLTA